MYYGGINFHANNEWIDRDKDCWPFQSNALGIKVLKNLKGKYAINDNGKAKFGKWFDNIGLLTEKVYQATICIGIYVKKGNQFAMLYHKSKTGDRKFMWSSSIYWDDRGCRWEKPDIEKQHADINAYLNAITPFTPDTPFYDSAWKKNYRFFQLEAGMSLNWIKDETIVLDDVAKLVPNYKIGYHRQHMDLIVNGKRTNYFHIQNVEYFRTKKPFDYYKDHILETFLERYEKAKKENDMETIEKLRKGLGYTF